MARRSFPVRLAPLGCAVALLGGGCRADAALEAQRATLEAEQAARLQRLEELEIRLIAVAARQRAWNELQDRHARISAIACENVAEHVAAMEAHEERQREKWRAQRAARRAAARARIEEGVQRGIQTAAVEAESASN